MPGDRKPSKRKARPERERIEYASDAIGWLREQLEPGPQQPTPPGPQAPERPRQAMARRDVPPPAGPVLSQREISRDSAE